MKPVWMPIVFASERPCPSFALKTFISQTPAGPDPSAAVPEIRHTPPSVSVPSTSIKKSLIFRARASTSGDASSASETSGMANVSVRSYSITLRRTNSWPLRLGFRRVEPCTQCGETRRWSVPSQLLHVVEERDVGPQRGECSKQHRLLALLGERMCQSAGAGCVHVPLAPVHRYRFQMAELGEHRGRRFRSPACQARIAVGRVAHQREVVRDRSRRDTEF